MPTTSALPALLAALVLCAHAPTAAAEAPQPALTSIETLDVPRYMGTWYEIARYPNRFQKHCAGFTQAEYRLQEDGRVRVANRCRTADGQLDEAIGTARQIGEAGSPRLKVRFAPAWLSFIPAVWGDYWVIDLDEDYRLAAVSEPGREYLWILSRTPEVAPAALDALRTRLAAQGFDLSRLEMTRQTD
ncbi:lipocalin family protein [Aromatoleum toluclasticum]|uniref:lipocalin family protein n=1 Tax=Aromatoleum toluclasticum TaxID=92003 RepID=UPI001D197058|nr:lipocalin family protein [Aromatoleum toluclasticum]MCC4113816.1 lipocalin family protein [Aromatoleum toluclasticum]